MVMTEATRNLVRDVLPHDVRLLDLGEHRLRDLREAEHIYQIEAEGLPTEFPPLKTVDRPLHNLPAQVTAFIGREQELTEAKCRLEEPGLRLLTLTGPGGTGKTRLALQVAADLIEVYPDGVWFVALASVASTGRIASAMAEALGVRESAGEAIEATLRAFLRSRRLLLVLDNFEHLVNAAPLIADLLATAPGLQILATSRTPLRITGEHELQIPPLGLPSEEQGLRPEDALASEAVRLFVDRARAVRGDFALTEANVETIAAICRRLDGLPLAIELAAARVRLLSPEAILARLDNRLGLLTGGGRDRPERQQTLRAAIAWSHDLLDPDVQTLFRRLAVFVGGWTLEAAETIVSYVDGPALSVLDGLETLNDNSLIRLDESVRGERLTDPRFDMLQTIHEFAWEQLAISGEEAALRDAHAQYYVSVASEAAPHLTGAQVASWLDRLDTDFDNLRAALRWLEDRNDSDRAIQLAASLWRFWWLRGHVSEGREQLEAALAIAGTTNSTDVRAEALDGAGVLAETQGDYQSAESLHQEALTLSLQSADTAGIARAKGNLGVVAFDRGDRDRAHSLLEESLELAQDAGDNQLIATALNDLGRVALERGELERAESLYRESLALRRASGSESGIARALTNLGVVALELGDFERACELYEESLSLYREVGDRWGAAGALNGLAVATRSGGDAGGAMEPFQESLELFEATGDARNSALALLNLADVARDTGDLDRSAAYYRDAIAGFEALDLDTEVADGLAGLAGVLASEGRFAIAARLLGAASKWVSGKTEAALFESEQVRADVGSIRTALGDDDFNASWAAGRELSLGTIIAETSAEPARS
jgi:predicted ATPase